MSIHLHRFSCFFFYFPFYDGWMADTNELAHVRIVQLAIPHSIERKLEKIHSIGCFCDSDHGDDWRSWHSGASMKRSHNCKMSIGSLVVVVVAKLYSAIKFLNCSYQTMVFNSMNYEWINITICAIDICLQLQFDWILIFIVQLMTHTVMDDASHHTIPRAFHIWILIKF